MSEQAQGTLIPRTKDSYGDSFKADLLEQYKLYVQSAENVSARRVASIRYLITLNTALIALYGFLLMNLEESYWAIPIPVIGMLVSLLWYLIIKSHADLNEVKFKVILEMERHLPAVMYDHEWKLAGEGKGKTYRAVTKIERWIPFMFAGLHAVLLVVTVLASIGVLDWPS